MLVVLPLILAACGSGDDSGAAKSNKKSGSQATTATTPPTTAAPTTTGAPPTTASTTTVKVASSSLGQILVDSSGKTLYRFDNDQGTTSACNAGCQGIWPPLTASSAPTGGAGVDATKLSTGPNSQVVYNGHLLYRYASDSAAGDTKGNGIGGVWHAVTPAGTAV